MSGAADPCLPIAALADSPEGGLALALGPFSEGAILVRVGGGVRAWVNRRRHVAVALDGNTPGEFLTRDQRSLVCGAHGPRGASRTARALRARARGRPSGHSR